MGSSMLADIGIAMRSGGFLLLLLLGWLVFVHQRDVLETAETASRILTGTFLVILQLAYYTTFALVVFAPSLDMAPRDRTGWTLLGLVVLYLLPLLATLVTFVLHPWLSRRQRRLRTPRDDDPIHGIIAQLSRRMGIDKKIDVAWSDSPRPEAYVFQRPFRPATLVLDPSFHAWARQKNVRRCADDRLYHLVLLHELAHVRNGDVFFMTWAGVFLRAYRFWAPLVVLVQIVLLIVGVGGLVATILVFGIAATVIIYPLFRLLYLSVSRQRELLADARARLYLGDAQAPSFQQISDEFAPRGTRQPPRDRPEEPRWRAQARTAGRMARRLLWDSDLLAVLPALEDADVEYPSFLATHPPLPVRDRALRERSLIQSPVGAVSSSVACWVGIVTGVYAAFLFIPFVVSLQGPIDPTTLEGFVLFGGFLTILYPVLALCLPLRNALAHLQPLRMQLVMLIWRFSQAGLCYLAVLLIGYVNMRLAYSLAGWGPIPLDRYAYLGTTGILTAPFMGILALIFMRELFRTLLHQRLVTIVWLVLITTLVAGVLFFSIGKIHLIDNRSFSHIVLQFATMTCAIALGLLTISRAVTASMDADLRTLTVYLGMGQARVRRWEFGTTVAHLSWTTLATIGWVGLVAVIPAWLAKLAFDALYPRWPVNVEGTLAWMALLAGLFAAITFTLQRTERVASTPTQAIVRRETILQDMGRLSEAARALGMGSHQVPRIRAETLPAELLRVPGDAPSVPWWLPAMPLNFTGWACKLATWLYGPGALSDSVADYVTNCAHPEGGFGLWPGGFARLGATRHALQILDAAGALDQVDGGAHTAWIAGCREAGGGFRSPDHGRPSLQDTADALQALALLDRLALAKRERCAEWIEDRWLRSERSLEQTCHAVNGLAALDALRPDQVELLESSWLPRYWSLVVSLRVDKQVDEVWRYVQIVAGLFRPSSAAFATWTDGLAANVAEGWAAALEAT